MPVREVARVNAPRRSCVSPAPSGPFASAASESSGSITFGRTKTSSSRASAVILAPRSAATATHFSIAARAGPRGWPTSGRKTSLIGIGILLRRQNRLALVGTLDPRQARELRPAGRRQALTEVKDWPRSASMDYPDRGASRLPTHLDVPAGMTDDSATQDRIFAALTNSADHPNVRRIDTHAASVFLEGRRALKIKRAVKFPFLDYSTLEKRKAACEEEIRINRPLAPQIYHRVVAITEEPDGSVKVDGRGRPIEYAVDMSRFDESQTLDHLAKAGAFDAELAAAIADAIAASHAAAIPAGGDAWVSSIPALIDGNSNGLRNGRHLPATEIVKLAQASQEALLRVRPSLAERGQQGFVRRCHGDLHLANIVLIDQQPVLFDAIEFDARIATVDVLYDLAFTLMDLLRHDQAVAANMVLNRYLTATRPENLGALGALPLFMSIRAAIRAQVALARLTPLQSSDPGILDCAHHYFDLARALIHPPAPRLIAVGGLSGTGKTVLARALAPSVAPQPGAVVLRSDVLRKQMFGVRNTDRLPPSAYTPELAERVY